jgi:hypothetical protein
VAVCRASRGESLADTRSSVMAARRASSGLFTAMENGQNGCSPSRMSPPAKPQGGAGSRRRFLLKVSNFAQRDIAVHVPDPGDAVGNEQGEKAIQLAFAQGVGVSIPEPCDQEFPCPINYDCIRSRLDQTGGGYRFDSFALDKHRQIGARWRTSRFDDRNVLQNQGGSMWRSLRRHERVSQLSPSTSDGHTADQS